MHTDTKIGTFAAMAVAIVVLAGHVGPVGPYVAVAASPAETAAPLRDGLTPAGTDATAAKHATWYSTMGPGRYIMPEPNTDDAGPWPVERVIVTVPGGWTQWGPSRGGGIRRIGEAQGQGPVARIVFGRVGTFYDVPPDCVLPDGAPGLTIDQLTDGLRAMLSDIEIADLRVNGYAARRIDFTTADLRPTCRGLGGWTTPEGGEGWNYSWGADQQHRLTLLEIDGIRFVIDASSNRYASPEVQAELMDITDSVEFESPTAPRASPEVASTEAVRGRGWPGARTNPAGVYSWMVWPGTGNWMHAHSADGISGSVELTFEALDDADSFGDDALSRARYDDGSYEEHPVLVEVVRTEMWLLDVDGTRVVIRLLSYPDTSPTLVAEAKAVIASIAVEPAGSGPGRRLTFTLPAGWDSG